MKIPVIAIPFGVIFVLYFFLAYALGATARAYYPYNPYYDYDFGYAKLPSSIKQVTVTLPPRFRNHGGRFGPLPYYAYGPRRSLYWHPKLNRKLFTKMEERIPPPQQIPESTLLKRSDDQTNEINEAPTSNSAPVPKEDELAIAFLTPAKEQISAFKKKIEELKNASVSDSAKAQMFADEMEKFNAKPSIITMGYKMWNWYKGYKESPAPFYSDPRTFNHPFGNKNKMLSIPPSAFATHYFQQDVPLVTKSTLGKTKSWMDEYNAMPEELAEENDNKERERSPKCTKGSSMLYCNGDALTDFMNALEKHVRNKKSRPSYYDSEGTKYYSEYEDDLNQNQMEGGEYSSDDYEKAKRGYNSYSKGKSKFKSFSSEDISSFNPYRNDNSLDKHFDIDIKDIQGDPSEDDRPMQILVVLTKKDFSGSSSQHSRSSSHSKPGIYPPKVVYDTSSLIAGKHRPIINTPEAWEDPSLYEDRENHHGYSKEDDYYYDKPRKSRSRSRSRSKSSSYKNNKYDKLMDELMNAIEGKIQDMDPHYDSSKDKNHNPSEINNDDYEPAPFWPVPRDFTSDERLKYARLKAAKAHFYGPEVGWFNRQ